ncbi:hypothetical protein [Aeromonas salmonicida]|uniref:hypothetical protein n=1 Tax=Aeromonas salmonicida TaxID=645 RepID=UPI000DE5B890|nr:hypothetical protein [Aeromonas salmonicida]
MVRQSLLLLVMLTTTPFSVATETFSFQSYQQGVLRMTLISPSLDGEAQLRHDKKLEVLTGVMMENLFTMRTEVPCQWLKADSALYWYLPGRKMLKAEIPAQPCVSEPPALPPQPPVLIYEKQGECLIDTAGNTLWRVATELAKRNRASIYQNVYAIFVTNKRAFASEDIHRLRSRRLYCPDPALVDHIEPEHASRMFKETVR